MSVEKRSGFIDRRISVAPMMDWTDRHCRFFLRQFSPTLLLYTEMINAAAILRGDRNRLLHFSAPEQPLAIQLGGSDPAQLAEAAQIAQDLGHVEVNLNCGCPSDRVHAGSFGACLMQTPAVVAQCVAAMKGVVRIPVTVKLRIGVVDRSRVGSSAAAKDAAQRFDDADMADLVQFSRAIVAAGADALIVHARKAVLGGMSPHENRTVPPLRYDVVAELKAMLPGVPVIVNGGLRTVDTVLQALATCDGVMIGREAYHRPELLGALHAALHPMQHAIAVDLTQVLEAMRAYASREVAQGTPLKAITRHMLGLLSGHPGAKTLRQVLSRNAQQGGTVDEVFNEAMAIAAIAA
ncbi:MAG: tRNA dihydrouridine(20/20a) synthase DusA [Steroidobacteraceae bacterium]